MPVLPSWLPNHGSIAIRPTIRTSRVNQLDADLLDDELQQILFEPFWNTVTPILGSSNWHPELIAILKVILLRYSLKNSFTYGAQLQNLKLIDLRSNKALSRAQITAYSLLAVLPAYLTTRLRDYMLSSGWADYPRRQSWRTILLNSSEDRTRRIRTLKRLIWDLSNGLEQIYSTLELLNFIGFLINGRYRSVLERLLGIGFAYARFDVRRNVSFEFLNRQVVWESITDFVLFLLPLINFKRVRLRLLYGKSQLKNWIERVFRNNDLQNNPGLTTSASKSPEREKPRARFSELSNDLCPICVTKRLSRSRSTISSNVVDPNDPMSFSASSSLNHLNSSSVNYHHSDDDRVKLAYQVNCCQGLYCYYCLMGEMITWRDSNLDRRWICWRCGNETTSIHRWNGHDVLSNALIPDRGG